MEFITIILILFIVIFPLLGDEIIRLLEYVNFKTSLASGIITTITHLKGPISWIVVFFTIEILYKISPDRKIPWHNTIGGAIFTTLAWVGITYCYAYYITHYANYSVFYGTLANIVILLMWLYFLSYAFVIGMAMNYHEELERTGVIDIVSEIQKSIQEETQVIDETSNPVESKEEENSKEEEIKGQ